MSTALLTTGVTRNVKKKGSDSLDSLDEQPPSTNSGVGYKTGKKVTGSSKPARLLKEFTRVGLLLVNFTAGETSSILSVYNTSGNMRTLIKYGTDNHIYYSSEYPPMRD